MPAINLDHICVDLPVFEARHRSFRRTLVTMGLGGAIHPQGRHTVVRALDDLSLTIQEGDRVGLIGHNGAGKSTLLRVLAGIWEPSAGRAQIAGSVSTLLNMGSILDPEMTGWENIEHGTLLLGITGPNRQRTEQQIADFTQLGAFLEMPVRTYSAGMQVRLSFALLTAQEPDILLLDEVMGVGDAEFVHKAMERLLDLQRRSRIVVLASHVDDHIRSLCNRVIWLEHGRLVLDGPTDTVLQAYANGAVPS